MNYQAQIKNHDGYFSKTLKNEKKKKNNDGEEGKARGQNLPGGISVDLIPKVHLPCP